MTWPDHKPFLLSTFAMNTARTDMDWNDNDDDVRTEPEKVWDDDVETEGFSIELIEESQEEEDDVVEQRRLSRYARDIQTWYHFQNSLEFGYCIWQFHPGHHGLPYREYSRQLQRYVFYVCMSNQMGISRNIPLSQFLSLRYTIVPATI